MARERKILDQAVSMTLSSLKKFESDLVIYHDFNPIELREAIKTVSEWDDVLIAGRQDYVREREAAFKAMKALKKSLSGRMDIVKWNELCFLESVIVAARKADDTRF